MLRVRVGFGQVSLDKAASAFCACSPYSAVRPASKGASPGTTLPAGEWETVQLRGCWRAGQTAGGSRNFASYPCNPCLPFSVPEGAGPRYIRITLHQHCRLSDSQLHPIGFHVFQVSWVQGEACCDTEPGFCHEAWWSSWLASGDSLAAFTESLFTRVIWAAHLKVIPSTACLLPLTLGSGASLGILRQKPSLPLRWM